MQNWCREQKERRKLTGGRDHVRSNGALEDSGEVVDKSANGYSLVTQASGRGLSDDRITDCADGNHVDEGRDD